MVKRAGAEEEWVEGDVIIAADGIKSIMREKMLALSGLKDEGKTVSESASPPQEPC